MFSKRTQNRILQVLYKPRRDQKRLGLKDINQKLDTKIEDFFNLKEKKEKEK